MKRFKVGDKVKLVEHHQDSDENDGLDIGSIGVVIEVHESAFVPDGQPYHVSWSGAEWSEWWVCAECLGDVKPISLENK